MKGSCSGWNGNDPGYNNNTKLGVGRSGLSDPDRHTSRPPSGSPSRQSVMKCDKCFDYNKGVKLGKCSRCGNTNACFKE